MDLSSTLARDCSPFYSLRNQGRSSSYSNLSKLSTFVIWIITDFIILLFFLITTFISIINIHCSVSFVIMMIRLRRTVADRKRLLTKVIEGLGQHGMVGMMIMMVMMIMVMIVRVIM